MIPSSVQRSLQGCRGVPVYGADVFRRRRRNARCVASLGVTPKILVLRMELVPYIDSSGARVLEAFVQQAFYRNRAKVILCDLRAQPAAYLDRIWSRFSGAERVSTFSEALSKVTVAVRWRLIPRLLQSDLLVVPIPGGSA